MHHAQLAALQVYAQKVGRCWKRELAHDWSRACSAHVDTMTYSTLHTIRNQYGPSWLDGFTFPGGSE